MSLPNTTGVRFIRSVIAEKNANLFRAMSNPVLYLEDELPAYTATAAHVAAYGKLPTVAALALEGIAFTQDGVELEPSDYYANQLRRRAAYNAINGRSTALTAALKAKDMDGAVATLREMLAEASGTLAGASYSSLEAEAQLVLADYSFAKAHPGMRGIPMRWPTLNAATGGAQGGDLIVIAGRPGQGKSWTLLEMALDAHFNSRTVGLASLEMGLMQIARRWLGGMTGINPNAIRDGSISQWSEPQLLAAVDQLATSAPVHLFRGDMRKNVDGIAAMMDEFDPEIMFVDAAYLLSPSGRKNGYVSRWESISEVIRELKQLALHKNRPVVITVQFNRNQRDRPKRAKNEGSFPVPDLGDVAGSDSIPQDASILIGQTSWPAPFAGCRRVMHGMKNREGETFSFGINFGFNPVNFDEIPLVEEQPGETIVDTSWML